MSENSIISKALYSINMLYISQIQMLLKWKSIKLLSDMNIIIRTSFSYFFPSKEKVKSKVLSEIGTYFDSISFLKKYLWSCYYIAHTMLGVGV